MIDEKLSLPNSSTCPSEAAQDIVNAQALCGRQRQAALLTVTMGRFRGPRCLWQVWGALCPLILRKGITREAVEKVFWTRRCSDHGSTLLSPRCESSDWTT